MSVQIFLQGKLLGIDEFLGSAVSSDPTAFLGRSHWISLISELLPRGLLAELGLAKILLGASGGDQFLVVIPAEARQAAFDILAAAAADIESLTGGSVQLVHASTENLGDWSDVRKRINEEMRRRRGSPAAERPLQFFAPFTSRGAEDTDSYFSGLARGLRIAKSAGWSPDQPGRVLLEQGKYTWELDGSPDAIPFVRHEAPTDDGASATPAQLGERASGRPIWGVLRGDVDNFAVRLRRLQTVEEHLQLSITYKQFFAGELKIQCSLPDFWRKTNIIYSGGDDFAVVGAWDALLPLARELQRVFQRFAAENLKDLPGAEGKTLTMALALASSPDASLGSVFLDAGRRLEIAKSADKDCIFALGRILEWKQLADAAVLKDELTRLVTEFGTSPEYINEMCGIYRETAVGTKRRGRATERPWRFHRRLNRILPQSRDREFQKARAEVIADLAGKNPAHVKLRPSGRVALEWARLSIEDQNHRG
jgi:CRISPR-associated protein Csm1